jgi:hypothetical protein
MILSKNFVATGHIVYCKKAEETLPNILEDLERKRCKVIYEEGFSEYSSYCNSNAPENLAPICLSK